MLLPRIEATTFDGAPAWRKRYGAEEHEFRLVALRMVARRFGLTPLLAPPTLAGEAARRTEQGMIERLAALGVRVPRVLAAGPVELLLSHLGENLSGLCKRETDVAARTALLRRGFDALRDLHARGACVSQAFARNLTVSDDGIGFIDLEQDPLTVMPLVSAQARDLLFFVHSTARFLPPPAYRLLLADSLRNEATAVIDEVHRTARRLAWLTPLAALGGRRGRAVGAAVKVLAT
jgi:hypothetical protein